MKVLLVYCHPNPESFCAALRDAAIEGLKSAGHDIDLLDLHAEGFDPVISREERADYHAPGHNRQPVAAHLDRLKAADALVFVYPTWWYAQPAMLKGWLDRVFIPHETFTLPEGQKPIRGLLTNLRFVAAITTLGSPWWWWALMGMPGRRILLSGIRALAGRGCRTHWLALHRIDVVGEGARKAFIEKVRREMGRVRSRPMV